MNTLTSNSALLLGASCVSAIAAVGSIFELSSGEPQLGSLATTIILAISLPLGAFLFYAAVKSAKQNQ